MPELWRFTAGDKGVNRVTVYEKAGSAQLYIEWWDDSGRHQKAIGALLGHPVTDKKLAERVARKVSEAQLQKRNQMAAEAAFGVAPNRTLGDLLARLQADKWNEWRPTYRDDQVRFRTFWEASLGVGLQIMKLSPAMVENVVRREGDRLKWSPRTRGAYLRYIVDAVSYGQHRLKWLTEQYNLSAVRIPKPRTKSKAYTEDEVLRLVHALTEVDPRAGFVGHVAWQTGRRLNAIRMLTREDVRVVDMEGEPVAVITFPGEIDKARNTGEALVIEEGARLAAELLERGTHYLIDEGGRPVSAERLLKEWLPEAEKRAEIPHVKGRAFHGIKRRFATSSQGLAGREKQSGTRAETLDREYVQDDRAPKLELAKTLARRVRKV